MKNVGSTGGGRSKGGCATGITAEGGCATKTLTTGSAHRSRRTARQDGDAAAVPGAVQPNRHRIGYVSIQWDHDHLRRLVAGRAVREPGGRDQRFAGGAEHSSGRELAGAGDRYARGVCPSRGRAGDGREATSRASIVHAEAAACFTADGPRRLRTQSRVRIPADVVRVVRSVVRSYHGLEARGTGTQRTRPRFRVDREAKRHSMAARL